MKIVNATNNQSVPIQKQNEKRKGHSMNVSTPEKRKLQTKKAAEECATRKRTKTIFHLAIYFPSRIPLFLSRLLFFAHF